MISVHPGRALYLYIDVWHSYWTNRFVVRIHRPASYTASVGSERASKTRQRERGQVCYRCGVALERLPAWTRGERACSLCQPRPHRVLMNFMFRQRWTVSFLAADCRTTLRGYSQISDETTLRRLVREGFCEDSEDFERQVRAWGQGSTWLRLTELQYRTLTRPRHTRGLGQSVNSGASSS